MKLRVIVTLLTVAVAAGSASGQSIGLFSDPGCASCNLATTPGIPATLWIGMATGGSVSGIKGAEFRVDGLPAGWLTISTPNPAANLALGDPFAGGCNIAFPECQVGACINLYTVTVIPFSSDVDVVCVVDKHSSPSNPNFLCALVNLCDAPLFTKVCVGAGSMFINSQADCTVAVEETTWSSVKSLYAN
ncbi:MAG: hypothetical protein ACE5G2_06235 [Candidatus Krumholzibacteriia bacterium]